MANVKYEMVRGDRKEDFPCIAADGWTPGGELFFVVKSQLDNESNDNGSNTVFKVDMTDADIVDPAFVVNGTTYKRYRCIITSDLTQNYTMQSNKEKLIAEYQFVAPGVAVTTWPQFTFTLYRDANRRRS
jgi:hypothetical protein